MRSSGRYDTASSTAYEISRDEAVLRPSIVDRAGWAGNTRMRKVRQIDRARAALARCLAERHSVEEREEQ